MSISHASLNDAHATAASSQRALPRAHPPGSPPRWLRVASPNAVGVASIRGNSLKRTWMGPARGSWRQRSCRVSELSGGRPNRPARVPFGAPTMASDRNTAVTLVLRGRVGDQREAAGLSTHDTSWTTLTARGVHLVQLISAAADHQVRRAGRPISGNFPRLPRLRCMARALPHESHVKRTGRSIAVTTTRQHSLPSRN
jgi:hypothetical protein